MIYSLIRPIVKFASKLYFEKIFLVGLENIEKGKPTILVCNHPSAFIEPCLLACFLPLKLHFLVRGDLFSKKWLSWLLKGTNQIPIFRIKDGINNVKKNHVTQKAIDELFSRNQCLLMFPEAHTHENLFLRPLKKGLSRFAFMTDHKELNILPIGVNFDKNIKFGSKVSIVIGEALSVADFKQQEFSDSMSMHKALLNEVSTRMKKTIRHIENEDKEDLVYRALSLLDLKRKLKVLPFISHDISVFNEEKNVATRIDENSESETSFLGSKEIDKLRKYDLPSPIDIIFMIVLAPLFALSYLTVLMPSRFAVLIIKKKVSVHEFKAPVYIAVMIFQYIFLVILLLLLSFFWANSLLILLGVVLSAVISSTYLKAYSRKWNYLFTSSKNRARFKEVMSRDFLESLNINHA